MFGAGELNLSWKGDQTTYGAVHMRMASRPRGVCGAGHPMTGDNVYVQPANGKRFCRACQTRRRHERTARDAARKRGGSQ